MMTLELKRFRDSKDDTLGLLFIDGFFVCFTIEDQAQATKIMHETRIPAGVYILKLRTYGTHHEKYAKRFPDIHKGMIEIEDVPGFTDILIHCGTTEKDTSGCVIVGNVARFNPRGNSHLEESGLAYARIYPLISQAILAGQTVKLFVFDK